MKVLHLFSNHKWTGPAEPALTLCATLRDVGVETDFACSAGPDLASNRIVEEARARGIEPILDMGLAKHRHPIGNWRDALLLRRVIAERTYDLVHTHLDNDHEIAVRALGNERAPLIVRSSYYGTGFPARGRFRRLLSASAFLIEPSQMALEHDAATRHFDRSSAEVIPGAIDLRRFDPDRELPDMRAKIGIPTEAFVIGIVARMQTHRRFEDLIDAAVELAAASDRVHFVFIGRGTKQDAVAYAPVQTKGLADRVHFTGYLAGDDYVGMLKAFDVKVFLVPGSDGTCRAVREAMAMGRPVVAARRGMLPELVEHEVTGLVVEEGASALTANLSRLEQNAEWVERLGKAAKAKARRDFDPRKQADRIATIYRSVLGHGD